MTRLLCTVLPNMAIRKLFAFYWNMHVTQVSGIAEVKRPWNLLHNMEGITNSV